MKLFTLALLLLAFSSCNTWKEKVKEFGCDNVDKITDPLAHEIAKLGGCNEELLSPDLFFVAHDGFLKCGVTDAAHGMLCKALANPIIDNAFDTILALDKIVKYECTGDLPKEKVVELVESLCDKLTH